MYKLLAMQFIYISNKFSIIIRFYSNIQRNINLIYEATWGTFWNNLAQNNKTKLNKES